MTLTTFLMLTVIFSAGFYLTMGKRWVDFLFGLTVLSNGVNLLLIQTSQTDQDALPQALILTAIVIGFGLLSLVAGFIVQFLKQQPNDEIPKTEEE